VNTAAIGLIIVNPPNHYKALKITSDPVVRTDARRVKQLGVERNSVNLTIF